MSDPPVKICPQCGKNVRRLIAGGAGIIFKGSGFYVNDSKNSSSGSLLKKSKDTKPTEESSPAATDKTTAEKTTTDKSTPEKKESASPVKSSA